MLKYYFVRRLLCFIGVHKNTTRWGLSCSKPGKIYKECHDCGAIIYEGANI